MWGQNPYLNNQQQYYQPPPQQQQPAQNESRIPLTPGVALLGFMGQQAINNNRNQWAQNPNQNLNYPSMNSSYNPQQSFVRKDTIPGMNGMELQVPQLPYTP